MKSALFLGLIANALANDNGLAITPPQGWRSWNLYHGNVNQDLITSIMDGMVRKSNLVNNVPTSLCDLGYCDVGLDDNWQACNSPAAAPGYNYHDKDGNPIVNLTTFPSLKSMTDHAHSLNLTAGWYGNNCLCNDQCKGDDCDKQIKGDVAALMEYNFDALKLDGCGGEMDLVAFNKYILTYNKSINVENCHQGKKVPFEPDRSLPPSEGCPWNFYRTSRDVHGNWMSIMLNLNSTFDFHRRNLSYPGCWAYPDMLQVGTPGLSDTETRAHFGAWAIVSSPLTLSHDVNNATVTAKIWDLISNTEVLQVNQAYVGDSGGLYDRSEGTVTLREAGESIAIPAHLYLYKPIGGGKVAVMLINTATVSENLTADFSKVPGVDCTDCAVRDIWAHKDLGSFQGSYTTTVGSHDAAFVIIG